MNEQRISTLVIQFVDLESSIEHKTSLENELKKAVNGEITFVPVLMEGISPIYYRDKVLESGGYRPTGSYNGFHYTGLTDDERAIRSFIDNTFDRMKHILAGRKEIIVRYTDFYKREARRIYLLIKDQELNSEVIFTNEF